jgi:hypothetical protein
MAMGVDLVIRKLDLVTLQLYASDTPSTTGNFPVFNLSKRMNKYLLLPSYMILS